MKKTEIKINSGDEKQKILDVFANIPMFPKFYSNNYDSLFDILSDTSWLEGHAISVELTLDENIINSKIEELLIEAFSRNNIGNFDLKIKSPK